MPLRYWWISAVAVAALAAIMMGAQRVRDEIKNIGTGPIYK